MLRFILITLIASAAGVAFAQDDYEVAANAVHMTKIVPVDSGICPRGTLIVVSKCRKGTLITCGSDLDEGSFSCGADGIPFHVVPAKTSSMLATILPRRVEAPAPRAKSFVYHSHRISHGRKGRDGLADFLSNLFQGKSRK